MTFRLRHLPLRQFYSVANFKQTHIRQYQTGIIFESDPADPNKQETQKNRNALEIQDTWKIGKITTTIKKRIQ
jgi:hypothetical protein